MEQDSDSASKRHPMQVVTRRTGLGADLLRAWEKRYRAVQPGRSEGGHRLYSDEDIRRLTLLRRAAGGGHGIGRIAHMNESELEELIAVDREAVGPPPAGAVSPLGGDPALDRLLQACLDSVERLDVAGLEGTLSRAALAVGSFSLVRHLLVPLMTTIGDRWESGRLRIVHEHMATSSVRSLLGHLARSQRLGEDAPRMVTATPAGQRHEMGALMVAAAAIPGGWNVAYLGADLPAAEIAAGADQAGARLVALSIVHPASDPALGSELVRLRELLSPGVRIVAGGSAAPSYDGTLRRIGASRLDGLDALGPALALDSEAR